jgi:hypothetical protein
MNEFEGLLDLPSWLLAAFGMLVVIQLAVEIYALVRLARTPVERLVFGKKWPWVLIIVFINLVGAIVFLVAGRQPDPAVDPLAAGHGGLAGVPGAAAVSDRSGAAERAADVLYGDKGGE